ncbi:MAG: hypothetical protein KDD04_01560 [Sinomicrobium sp.]|nr:hypothetical protein [Sinomicrobium sp.]
MDTAGHNEKYIRDAVKKAGLEQPSLDFTAGVMQKLTASEKATVYRPLIPVKGWLVMAAAVVIFTICAFYFGEELTLPVWLKPEKISGDLVAGFLDQLTLSRNMIYGILLTGAVILLQIPILKSRHYRTLWRNHYQ